MRKIRIFLFELIGVGILLGWLVWKYPELVESIIPWIALAVMWHATWEFVLEPSKEGIQRLTKGAPVEVKWIFSIFLFVAASLCYHQGINNALRALADYRARSEHRA